MCESIDSLLKIIKELGFTIDNSPEIKYSTKYDIPNSISILLITPEYNNIRKNERKLNREKLKNVLHPIT